ncbi:MAG: hypothetical protein ABSA79_07990 [Candidatus Bathyarchaeia archaeon]
MILDDIARVIYAPATAFKKIIENPKYLGAIIILLLFIGLQMGYAYAQFSKTYTENTSPAIGQLSDYINATAAMSSEPNSTLWRASAGVTISNNFDDYFNYSVYVPAIIGNYSLFGNSSLEIDANNASAVSAALSNAFNVSCAAGGFENLSMTLKQVQPQIVPTSATITLYSVADSNYYTYDLTSLMSNSSDINQWNNLTIPVGPSAQGWAVGGAPSWGNITALKLDFNYPSGSNFVIRIGALFFHGEYQTFIQTYGPNALLSFLEAFSLQFIFSWLLLTGLIYLFFKGLKANITWKPLFVAVVFALFVMVIRSVVNIAVAFTLPTVYYPFDVSLGVTSNPYGAIYVPVQAAVTYTAQSQAVLNNIVAVTSGFDFVVEAMFLVSYVWLGALCTIIVGTLQPEFSMMKRILIAAVSVAVTWFVLVLFVGFV